MMMLSRSIAVTNFSQILFHSEEIQFWTVPGLELLISSGSNLQVWKRELDPAGNNSENLAGNRGVTGTLVICLDRERCLFDVQVRESLPEEIVQGKPPVTN